MRNGLASVVVRVISQDSFSLPSWLAVSSRVLQSPLPQRSSDNIHLDMCLVCVHTHAHENTHTHTITQCKCRGQRGLAARSRFSHHVCGIQESGSGRRAWRPLLTAPSRAFAECGDPRVGSGQLYTVDSEGGTWVFDSRGRVGDGGG